MWVVCVLCLPHLVVDLLWSLRGMVITDKQEEDHHECRDQTQTHTHTHTHSHTHTLGCKSSLMVPSPAVSSLKCARRPLSSSWSLISSLSHFFPGLHPPSTHNITHSSYVTLLHSLLMSVLCSTYWLWIRAHHQHTVRNTASAVQLLYLCVLCVCVCVCVCLGEGGSPLMNGCRVEQEAWGRNLLIMNGALLSGCEQHTVKVCVRVCFVICECMGMWYLYIV